MNGTRPAGFTLVEMLVSMAVGMVVLLIAVGALRSTADGYDRRTGRVAAEREARAVLAQLAVDLSKAVAGGQAVFERSEAAWRRDRLGFLCLQPEEAQSAGERTGDLCAVVYYVKEIRIGQSQLPCLMRGFRNSGEVFPARDATGPLYDARAGDEPVAFGVLAFEAEPVVGSATGAWLRVTPPQVPTAVRLRLVVARRELAGKLRREDDWTDPPLAGEPEDAGNSKYLEVHESIQPFGHGA